LPLALQSPELVHDKMFFPWIKRKALKRSPKTKTMVVEGTNPSLITLLSLSALMAVVGVFAVRHSHAATPASEGATPALSAPPSTQVSPSSLPGRPSTSR
jgi:hypothetical protein